MKIIWSRFPTRIIFLLLLISAIAITSCKKENNFTTPESQTITNLKGDQHIRKNAINSTSDLPDVDISLCHVSPISRADITPITPVEELADGNGFRMSSGSIKMNIGGKEVSLKGLHATFRFCENDRLIAIEGTAGIPSPIECIDFGNAFDARIGFYTGHVINETLGLDFNLPVDRAYFVFLIEAGLGAEICTSLDNPENRPINIEIPDIGFSYKFITDFTDPFYYLELPIMNVAESAEGVMEYVPVQPVPEMQGFNARSYVNGSFPMCYGLIQVDGHLYQNLPSIVAQLASDNPFDFPIEEGYLGGINGYMELGLPIKRKKKKDDKNDKNDKEDNGNDNEDNSKEDENNNQESKDSSNIIDEILSFSIPLGEASAALTAVPIDGKIYTKAFLNTQIEPDNSWWPQFIPFRPAASLNVQGFVQQDGDFRIGLTGNMGIQTSNNGADVVNCLGTIEADNDQLVLRGELNGPNEGWAINADIGGSQTDIRVEIPESLTSNFDVDLKADIEALEKRLSELQKQIDEAKDQLQIELSLKGLRDQLPVIADFAINALDDGVADAKKRAKDQINRSSLCDKADLIRRVHRIIDNEASPHYTAINQFKVAADPILDNESARVQLEQAIEALIDLKRFCVNINLKVKVGKRVKVPFVGYKWVCVNTRFKFSFCEPILNDDQVALLQQAANNIQYIQPSSNLVFDLEATIGELPSPEIIETVKHLPSPKLEQIGFIINTDLKTYQYYAILGGTTYYGSFDPFNWPSILKGINDMRIEAAGSIE